MSRAQRRTDRRDRPPQAKSSWHELTPQRASLEQAFMSLTGSSVEFQAGVPAGEIPEVAA